MDTAVSPTNWITSVWQQVPGSATSGSGMSWRCQIGSGSQPVSGDYSFPLTLNGTINMQSAVNPKLWFSWRAGSQHGNLLYAQASIDGGKNWTSLWGWDSYTDKGMAWTRQQVDLNAYAGYTNLALRFLAYNRPPGYRFAVDFQVDDVLLSEGGGCPAILTMNPLPNATLGYAYNQILQVTNGSAPYVWSVVSNSLPPGLTLDPVGGILTGTPTNAGTYSFWLGVNASNVCAQVKPFSLTVEEYLALFPAQSAQAFVSPGTNVVYCQVDNQTARRLLSLVWVPTLPAGWAILGASGDGAPEVGPDGKILFQAANLTNSPLKFTYSVRVPAGETQARQIGGLATVLLENMILERTVPAFPNPLFTLPRVYHSADCTTNWVIDSTESSRVLAYWRAQAYSLDGTTCDGYAPGTGASVGPLHSADYQAPAWQIDGTELNRVLAYWRAGCYRPEAAGADGYAACTTPPGLLGRSGKDALPPTVVQKTPTNYTSGSTFIVTNTLEYTGSLLSLLWRPHLPAGWTIGEVLADGAPEPLNGEFVWTATNLPPSPVKVLYIVQVPLGQTGPKQITNQVEYQYPGMVNPGLVYASPNPATVYSSANPGSPQPSFVRFTTIQRQPDGAVRLGLLGNLDTPVQIQWAAELSNASWTTLTSLPSLNGTAEYMDTSATDAVQRFYRVLAP
jgi:hypothetical protein